MNYYRFIVGIICLGRLIIKSKDKVFCLLKNDVVYRWRFILLNNNFYYLEILYR